MRFGPLCLIVGLVGACGAPEDAPEAGGFLEIHAANATDGLNGSYAIGDRVINFETVRIPSEKGAANEGYEIALKITDADGHPLLTLTEGSALPEEWVAIDTEERNITSSITSEVIALATGAAEALESAALDASIKHEQEMVTQELASFVRLKSVMTEAELAGPKKPTHVVGQSSAALRPNTFKQVIYSYWKPAFMNGVRYDHSATETVTLAAAGGGWFPYWYTKMCNHGSCPDQGMTWYATHWGDVTAYPVSPQECPGMWGVSHLCNNDTILQQYNVRWSTFGGANLFCGYRMFWRPTL